LRQGHLANNYVFVKSNGKSSGYQVQQCERFLFERAKVTACQE